MDSRLTEGRTWNSSRRKMTAGALTVARQPACSQERRSPSPLPCRNDTSSAANAVHAASGTRCAGRTSWPRRRRRSSASTWTTTPGSSCRRTSTGACDPWCELRQDVPNKLGGTGAIASVFVPLSALPFIDKSQVRSSNFRPCLLKSS